jgi:hypothetical protein
LRVDSMLSVYCGRRTPARDAACAEHEGRVGAELAVGARAVDDPIGDHHLKAKRIYRRAARPDSCGATAHFPNPQSR